MDRSTLGVRRPALYLLAAALGVAVVIPLAIYSGQSGAGGIFEECFGASCSGGTLIADSR
ncbi:MAG: hypothetical protein AAGJ73_08195 [Pseudomonadota bacterium]